MRRLFARRPVYFWAGPPLQWPVCDGPARVFLSRVLRCEAPPVVRYREGEGVPWGYRCETHALTLAVDVELERMPT